MWPPVFGPPSDSAGLPPSQSQGPLPRADQSQRFDLRGVAGTSILVERSRPRGNQLVADAKSAPLPHFVKTTWALFGCARRQAWRSSSTKRSWRETPRKTMLAILVPVALSQGRQRNKVTAAGEQPKSRRPASSRSRRTSTPHPSQRLPPGGRHLRRPRAGEAPLSSKLLVTGNPVLGECKPAETSAQPQKFSGFEVGAQRHTTRGSRPHSEAPLSWSRSRSPRNCLYAWQRHHQ